LRHLLYVIAQRVHMPVYQIERDMPAHELAEWIMLLRMEAAAREPPGVADVGLDDMAAQLGVRTNGE
jgi:hypothetical protein